MKERKNKKMNSNFNNSCQLKSWRLFQIMVLFFIAVLTSGKMYAHQSPNTLLFLDITPGKVSMEIQMPVPELELAFGNNISKDPEAIIKNFGPRLKEYLKAHIHAYAMKSQPWVIDIDELRIDKGKYIETGIPYWEVNARVILKPKEDENTRNFFLDYDVIMHQVINHVALLSIRSDWETGSINANPSEVGAIGWNVKDNVIYPYEINLEKGSDWRGFKSIVNLGMQHIKEGTDHLLFLIVLLLPATLLVQRKKWGKFGGIKYSITRLLKIVTAFTIGHSVTLLIGALGLLKLPQQPIEILIAISILVSAIHAIYPVFPGKEMYIAAGFGLIHGLAFASVLSGMNLGAGTLALSILGFNLGIELMQLFIIAMIIPWLILLSKTSFYSLFRITGAVLAGIAALAWIVERTSGNANFITGFLEKATQYGVWCIVGLAAVSIIAYTVYSSKKRKSFARLSSVNIGDVA